MIRPVLLIALCIGSVPWVQAQESSKGRLLLDFGYRWLEFAGSEELYRSHVDLGEGPKFFAGQFEYRNAPNSGRFFDSIEVRMNNWGGDPYNTAGFRLARRGVFDLNFDYKNFRYFSSVPNFANPFFESGNVISQHRFDVRDRVFGFQLKLLPGKTFEPFFAYQRSGRRGPVATTVVADSDEFLLSSESDSNSDDFRGGVTIRIRALTLTLEQGVRKFEDHTSYLAEGFQEGNRSRPILGRDLFLNDYEGSIDTRADLPFSRATATFTPHSTLTLGGNVTYGIADSETRYLEDLSGNFFPFPRHSFFYENGNLTSQGRSKRPGWYADLYAVWEPHWRFRLSERFRSRRFHVSGSAVANMTFLGIDPLLGRVDDPLSEEILYDQFLAVDRDVQEIRGRFYLWKNASIEAGHRWEKKQVQTGESFEATRNSIVLGFSYRHNSQNRFFVEYERGRSDDAVFRTDASDLDRFRLQAHFAPTESLRFHGQGALYDHDNPELPIDLAFRQRSWGAGVSYVPGERISVSASYQRTHFRHQINIIRPEILQEELSLFRERGDYADAFVSLVLPARGRLDLGYSVWGSVGNFPVTYHRPVGEIEFDINSEFSLYGRWNHHGYNEKVDFLPQSYRAHLITFGVRIKVPDLAEFFK